MKHVRAKGIPHILLGRSPLFELAEVSPFLKAGVEDLPEFTSNFAAAVGICKPRPSTIVRLPAPPKRASLYTYLVWAVNSNRYKIGSAKNPHLRLLALNTGSPLELKLIAAIPSRLISEDALHTKHWGCRVKGEWFAFKSLETIMPAFGKWTAEYYYNSVREAV